MKRLNIFYILLVVIFANLFLLHPVFAQASYFPKVLINSRLSTNPNSIISTGINFTYIIIGLIFFIMIVISGVEWLISGGDEKKTEGAKSRIINALIGVVIVAGAYLIIEVVGSLLGINSIFSKSIFVKCNSSNSNFNVCIG
jgi:hypothetical protein